MFTPILRTSGDSSRVCDEEVYQWSFNFWCSYRPLVEEETLEAKTSAQ
jgi:hypothetical protein